jgi:hypothetical protein
MSVLVAKIGQSPWPEFADTPCDRAGKNHPAAWAIWTEEDTGDGMRLTCDKHLAGWIGTVWDRIDGLEETDE